MPEVIDLNNPRRQRSPEFCRTPTAAAILDAIDIVNTTGEIGVIVGAPGVGKTTVLTWYAEEHHGVKYNVMNPTLRTNGAVLGLICQNVGILQPRRPKDMRDALCDWALTVRAEMLVIDEAQHLNDEALDTLRSVNDDTDLPMIFSGNETLHSRFNNERQASFAQFNSRIGMRLSLKTSTTADVEALARHYGVHDPRTLELIHKVRAPVWGLRGVARLLSTARRHAAGDDAIRLEHVRRAVSTLGLDRMLRNTRNPKGLKGEVSE